MIAKRKKVQLLLLFAGLIAFFFIGGLTIAEGVKLEESSSLLLDSYNLDRFNSYVSSNTGLWGVFTGDTVPNAISGLSNIFYTGTKIFFQVFDAAIELMYSLNVLEKLNDIISTLTNSLWGTFKANYVPLIVVIAILIVARTYMFENSKEALKQFARVILVLVIAGVWFPQSSEFMNSMNDYSFILQADIMTSAGSSDATSAIVGGGEWVENENGEQVREYDEAQSSEIATNTIRNELFTQTVFKPFLLLNYGTTEKDKIDAMYEKLDNDDVPKDTGGTYLLSDDFAEMPLDDKQKFIDSLAGTEDEPINYYMSTDSVGYKFIISLIYFVGVFLYGTPLVAIAFLNVLLQLLAIIYSYILPIIALLSLFPKYSNGLLNSIITIGKIFMGKAFLGMLVLLFSLVNLTLDLLIPQSTMVFAILNLVIKGVVYFLAIKYRKELISAVTKALTGRVSVDTLQNYGSNQRDNYQEQMQEFTQGNFTPHLQLATPDGGMYDYYQPYTEATPDMPKQSSANSVADENNIDDPQTNGVTVETWNDSNNDTVDKQTEADGVTIETWNDGNNDTSDPQSDTTTTIDVDDPQVTVDEQIDVDDPQVTVDEQIDVDDPQVTVDEQIDVDDPQVTVDEQIHADDPQVKVENEQTNVQDTQESKAQQTVQAPPTTIQNQFTQTADVNQSMSNENTYETNEVYTTNDFHENLERLRG